MCALGSCVAYEPDPIEPAALLAELEAERGQATLLDLRALEASLCERNEAVVRAGAEFSAAVARVEAGVPLPNPELEAGPVFLDGAGITGAATRGVEAALGWTVRWFGAAGLLEDLDAAAAQAQGLRLAATVREQVLALRAELVAAAFAGERAQLAERLRTVAAAALELQERMIAGGRATALDRERAALRLERASVEAAAAAADAVRARGAVAERCGVGLARVPMVDRTILPSLPAGPLLPEDLWQQLTEAPELLALHGEHRTAEARLRLEVRRQYPDLLVGLSYEREESVDRWSLPLGIELPLFDTNQRGIAEAAAARRAARARYIAALRRRGAQFDTAWAGLELRAQQWQRARDSIGPRLDSLRALRARAVAAGSLSGLEALQLEQDLIEAELLRLDAEAQHFDAWMDLEHSWGAPLVAFPTAAPKPGS